MRYTTVIDITEFPTVYRNIHCRILYLHMCLRAGYHDEDRDVYKGSIRTLALHAGLTVSATRHALAVLMAAQLLAKTENGWRVTKWVLTPSITARPKSRQEAADKKAASDIVEQFQRQQQEGLERRKKEEKQQEMERRKWLEETDFSEFVKQYEAIQEKVQKNKGGVSDTIFLGKNQERYEYAKEQVKRTANKETK